MRSVLAIVVACAAAIAAFAGDDVAPAPPATKPYSSADGRITVELPAAWDLKSDKRDKAAMAWTGKLPDGGGAIDVVVYHVPGFVNARQQPFAERDVHPGRFNVKGPAHAETDVLPHLWLDVPEAGAATVRVVWIYRVIRRNGFTINVECLAESWPKVRAACLRAGQTLATTIEEWPAPPAGYARRVRDGIVYYVQPGAGDSDAAVHAIVRAEQQSFTRLHGAVAPDPESPLVVVVHAKSSAGAAAADDDQSWDSGSWRLVAVEPPKGDDNSRAKLVRSTRSALLAHRYGGATPTWIYFGESLLSWMQARTGKPAPFVLEGFPTPYLPKLEDLAAEADGDKQEAMFVYVAFFLGGPRLYRDAFAAYMKDVSATGDCATAQKAHLFSLDQEKLRDAAQKFAEKELKQVKPK